MVTASNEGLETVRQVSGLSQLAGKYKALLLDQFGVLHDGRRPYPGAVEAVAAAAAAGLRLLVISNSSRRSGGTLAKLAGMGFDPAAFEGVVTSGELTHRYLTSRPDGWWAGLGRRVFHINWSSRGPASLEGYGLEVVVDPRDADFLLAHGTEAVSLPGGGLREVALQELRELLTETAVEAAEEAEAAAAVGRVGVSAPPLVVANPDVVTVDGDELVAMPGSLAAAYAAAGGPVVLMGKPAPLIYAACGELLGLPACQMLAVGDSLEHDIAGACAAGIDSLLIAGGIHARELMLQQPEAAPGSLGAQQQQQQAPGQQGDDVRPAAAALGAAAPGLDVDVGVGVGVDIEALQRLCERHLAGGAAAAAGPGGGGGGAAANRRAPMYVARRFVW